MPSLPHNYDDAHGRLLGILVLPNTDGQPAYIDQLLVSVAVPFSVAVDLFTPEVGIRFGPCRVLRAAMPVTPIDEDGHTGGAEYNIRLTP